MFVLDILFLPLGLFMMIAPSKLLNIVAKIKKDKKTNSPTPAHLKHIRECGLVFFILGVICTVLTFVFNI